jgi:mannose-1-phosphate guanylyltransferase
MGDRAATRWAVVLAGGVGSRFWPLSTPERPKQLLPLISANPMLRDTLDRLAPVAPLAQTLILTNAGLVQPILAGIPGLPAENLIAEPRPAGTAAALAWAAKVIADRAGSETPIISVHADWAIGDVEGFRKALIAAADAATAHQALVTVGIVPTYPNPSLGHILPGDVVDGALRRVSRFIEKPDVESAKALNAQGALWNSGIFAWRACDILDEVAAHCPEVAPALASSGKDASAFFGAVTSIAIDHGVLERTSRMMVLPGDFGWSDVGTWAALLDVRARDGEGNAAAGRVLMRDAHDNVVHADGTTVVCYGVDGLVVVALNGMTMVTTVERANDLKSLLDELPDRVKSR